MSTLQNMRAFVRVVEAGSFIGAARETGVSTAQVSRLVAELEGDLGAKLLHRTTRRTTLTSAGERYVTRARAILSAVDEARTEVSGAHIRASGTLRIHCVASFALHHLIPLLARYRREHPEVTVQLTLSQRMPKLVEEGHDVAIVFSPATQGAGLVVRRIATSHYVLCASPGYLREHGAPATPADLAKHACMNLEPPDNGGDWSFHGPGGTEIHAVRPILSVNVAEAMVTAIREGMGIGLLFGYSAVKSLRSGDIVRVLPDHRLNEFNVFAMYPAREYLDAKVGTWIDFLNRHLPAAMAADRAVLEATHEAPEKDFRRTSARKA